MVSQIVYMNIIMSLRSFLTLKYYIFCVLILLTVIIVNELKPNNDRVGTIISKCIGVQTLV